MSIQAFKLIGGEDVIGEVVSTSDFSFELKSPAVIVVQRSEDGRVGVGLQPYVPFASDTKVTLFKAALCATFDVDSQLKNEYNRIFGNGIVIAGANELPR